MKTNDTTSVMDRKARRGWLVSRKQRLPKDLTAWVGSIALVRLALQAVEQAGLPDSQKDFKTAFGTFRPKMLLTLLTYAYAKGLSGSRDIELSIPNNQTLKYICAGARPDWNSLRLFRRQHPDWVQTCLAEVLRQAWDGQFPATPPAAVEFTYAAASLDRWVLPQAPNFEMDAANRVRLAILADTLLADE